MKKKPKPGIPLREAMERGFNQVIGLPGVSYAKGGKFYTATLVEVNERGEPVPEKPSVVDVDDGGFVADTIGGSDSEQAIGDSIAGSEASDNGNEPNSHASTLTDGSVPSETVQGSPAADVVDSPLQVRFSEAKAELDAWTAANDASTEEGKREYNRLYARVRSAKKALEKAGA